MLIKTLTGLELGGAVSSSPANSIPFVDSGTRLQFGFSSLSVSSHQGVYFLNAGVQGIVDGTVTYLDRHVDVLISVIL